MKGRIPESFIDDLLARLDIVEVVNRRVPLKKGGKNYMACCPFHDEKTPSFSVSPDKQFYYCFGCGAGGNAIGFIMEYDRQEFPQAVETLANIAGLEVPREDLSPQQAKRQEKRKDLYSIMEAAANFYKEQLRSHHTAKRAVDYLKNRGLDGKTSRDFGLGYAPPGWVNLLDELGKTDQDKQLLIEGGLVIEREDGKIYDRFRDRIMFPILDSRGRVIAFGGRVLGDDKPKYLNSPETPIFHKGRELYGLYNARQAKGKIDRLIVVEGYMDVIALAQAGIPCAVATLGTATSTDHIRLIFRHSPEVVFCFDGDEAGRKAGSRAMESALPAMEDGRSARFLYLPEGEDPDTQVRELGKDRFAYKLQQAQPLESFLFDSLEEDTSTFDGKARLAKRASPLVQTLPDGVYKTLMLDELAKRSGLSPDQLKLILQQSNPLPPTELPAETAQPSGQNTNENAPYSADGSAVLPEGEGEVFSREGPNKRDLLPYEIRLLTPALQAIGTLLREPAQVGALDELFIPAESKDLHLSVLKKMIDLIRQKPGISTVKLWYHWHGTPEALVLSASQEQEDIPELPEVAAQKLLDISRHINKGQHKQSYKELVQKLKGRALSEISDEEKQQLVKLLPNVHQ